MRLDGQSGGRTLRIRNLIHSDTYPGKADVKQGKLNCIGMAPYFVQNGAPLSTDNMTRLAELTTGKETRVYTS